MLRNIFKNCCLVIGSLLVGFLIFEIILRFAITLPSPFAIADSRLIFDQRGFWLNLPSQNQVFSNQVDFDGVTVSNDENGLRRVPCRKKTSEKSVQRIYIVGDSQTYGWGLSDGDTWPNQLQCLLNKSGEKFEVWNLGVPGTNLDQYYYRTRMFYDFVRPDDIVVYVITWNDWHSDQSNIRPISLSEKCTAKPLNGTGPAFCPSDPARYYGLKTSWRRNVHDAIGVLFPSFDSLKAFSDTVVFSSAVAYLTVPPLKALYLRKRKTDTLQRIGASTLKSNITLVKQIASDIRKTENVHFVFLPSRISYADKVFEVYSKNRTVFKNQDFLFDLAKGACQKHKLRCHSLFSALHMSDIGSVDFKFDGHLNADGAREVANYLFENIIGNAKK